MVVISFIGRTSVLATLLFISIVTVLLFSPRVGATGEQVTMKMPFDGTWAYNTPTSASCGTGTGQTAHPSCHTTNNTSLLGYDWATDYYANDGTDVKVNGSSSQGTVSFSSSEVLNQSCGRGLSISTKANGNTAGEVYVTHLTSPLVSSSISSGSSIGTVSSGPFGNGCFGVDHVHFSYKNTVSNHACYANYSTQTYTAGIGVNYGAIVGVIGATNSDVQQECTGQTIDSDGDGFADASDQCPTVFGTINGCPDTDGDGIIDSNDSCPSLVGPAWNGGCPEEPQSTRCDVNGDGYDDVVSLYNDGGSTIRFLDLQGSLGGTFATPIQAYYNATWYWDATKLR